jgi:hypothetical protein
MSGLRTNGDRPTFNEQLRADNGPSLQPARRRVNVFIGRPCNSNGRQPWALVPDPLRLGRDTSSNVHWSYSPPRRTRRRVSAPTHSLKDSTARDFMTGYETLSTLRPGDYLRLAHGGGKVHRAYSDQHTGEIRICRPSMLGGTRRADRQWAPSDAKQWSEHPCDKCC